MLKSVLTKGYFFQCFMNSFVQCLSNTKPFLEYVLSFSYKSDINRLSQMGGRLIEVLAQLIKNIWKPNGQGADPTAFKVLASEVYPALGNGQQQDAHECMRLLFDRFHDDINKIEDKLHPLPHHPFYDP